MRVAKANSLRNQSLQLNNTQYASIGQVAEANGPPWGLIIAGTLAVGGIVGLMLFYGRN